MVWVMVVVRVRVVYKIPLLARALGLKARPSARATIGNLVYKGQSRAPRVLIFPPEPSKECVKVSHVIFECRVINHHPSKFENPLSR